MNYTPAPPLTLEEARKIIAFRDVSDTVIRWILDRCIPMEIEDGTTIVKTGELMEYMVMIVEGTFAFYMDMNGRLVHYINFQNDEVAGGAAGVLPYSRMINSPGYSYAVGNIRGFLLHKSYFPELEQLDPAFIQKLIGYMTERVRVFATTKLQHEKVNALGNLAAGIAHELNNPAAAINRISAELTKRLKLNYELTESLLKHSIEPEYILTLKDLVAEKSKNAGEVKKLTTLQRMNLEDEMTDWMEQNGLSAISQTVDTFADSGMAVCDLETIKGQVGIDALSPALLWLENLMSSEKTLKDLGDASCRISNLVGAIKSHVHMDRTNDVQKTRINKDIENTLTLLGYKLREKNLTISRKFAENLPEVDAYIGELNQVWTNLIDNAIHALADGGEICIQTSFDAKNITVKVVDNGSGIPKEIISRIFDPFFTTKKVGEGTGIGLDLVMRIVKRHQGEIKVESVPGRTEFSVCIPLVQKTKP